jgi:hypothetical protein
MSKSVERFVGGVLVSSKVLDGTRPVEKLKAGSQYGHMLTVSNEAVWPFDIVAQSALEDSQQLAYINQPSPEKWSTEFMGLAPNREKSQSELVKCLSRTSGRDAIITDVLLNNNVSGDLTFELKVE